MYKGVDPPMVGFLFGLEKFTFATFGSDSPWELPKDGRRQAPPLRKTEP